MIWRNMFTIHMVLIVLIILGESKANDDAKRLLDDLFSVYNNVARPVLDENQKIELSISLKLSQIADIDEKNQIMTTNVWLRHEWKDHKLHWNPYAYGNISKINIPSDHIWLPDIVLYNNADGDYQITTKTKVTIYNDGRIVWEPPMIYKSYCAINIEYYPFDIQDCYMKFGTWSSAGDLINLEHMDINDSVIIENPNNLRSRGLYHVEMGIDMSDYYQSVEWDVLEIPAQKNIKVYDCCPEPYLDIYFNITIRRKTLFYTVNLIVPCVNISFLSVLVFYLPSDSGEKLTLGISILVALLVFYLLLIDLIPPTSLVIPLLGKYLLFTLILVNLSILLTIFILNLHHRKPSTHKMPFWMKRVFIDILPKMLMIERPYVPAGKDIIIGRKRSTREEMTRKPEIPVHPDFMPSSRMKKNISLSKSLNKELEENESKRYPKNILDALHGIQYIKAKMKEDNNDQLKIDDWKYASMVIDRLLLWIFTAACLIGTCGILLQAPSIYDERQPLRKSRFDLIE